jgi:D-arginine dehydrogenase
MPSPTPSHDSSQTDVIIIGSGFAGAATAWALSRFGAVRGLILEKELVPGTHASGRNAAMARQIELDPVLRTLAIRSQRLVRSDLSGQEDLVRITGSLILGSPEHIERYAAAREEFSRAGVPISIFDNAAARARFPFLSKIQFEHAAHCPQDGIVDVHALLTRYLQEARSGGFRLRTACTVQELIIEGGKVRGVETELGRIYAPLVIDASGAWAGRLGRSPQERLNLTPMRRHLFITSGEEERTTPWPFVWDESVGYYFRPEGSGLLFSACDETPMEPCLPTVDPEVSHLLAQKLSRHAPGMWDRSVQRAWACLRTFASDQRPVIGPDPVLPGLFHVSGLGGFGMTCSASVGQLAAQLIRGEAVDWIDVHSVSAERLTGRPLGKKTGLPSGAERS